MKCITLERQLKFQWWWRTECTLLEPSIQYTVLTGAEQCEVACAFAQVKGLLHTKWITSRLKSVPEDPKAAYRKPTDGFW